MSTGSRPRGAGRSLRPWLAALRDPRVGGRPPGVERPSRLLQIDDHRRVAGRYRLALARLAVDLRPDDAGGDGVGREQVIDAHAVVLVEHAGAVVPPAVALGLDGLGVKAPVSVDEAPAQEGR